MFGAVYFGQPYFGGYGVEVVQQTAPQEPNSVSAWFVDDYSGSQSAEKRFVIDEPKKRYRFIGYRQAKMRHCDIYAMPGKATFVRSVTPEQDEKDLADICELIARSF